MIIKKKMFTIYKNFQISIYFYIYSFIFVILMYVNIH